MIPFTSIYRDKENPNLIHPYANREVVLFGDPRQFKKIVLLLEYFQIKVVGCCSPEESTWGTVSMSHVILSTDSLLKWKEAENKDSLLIQLVFDDSEETIWKNWCIENDFPHTLTEEAMEVLGYLKLAETAYKEITSKTFPFILKKNALMEGLKAEEYAILQENTPLFLCMPPKTGDHSLIQTFQKLEIPHHFIFHQPSAIPMDYEKPMKIITAVRDPLAETVSFLYQVLGDLSHSVTAHYLINTKNPNFFTGQSGDIQDLFTNICENIMERIYFGAMPIQTFMPEFFEKVLDLTAYPFDQEKGYSVIKKGNISVFVYQLERLDDVLSELSAFVGKDIVSLEKGNLTEKKWVGESYKIAQKELTFSQEFFDFSYGQPWVSHCYRESQLEEMKNKWTSQISC